ncbi:hypothetical protein MJT46_012339 [Ovis ammon polii x Ovis aries]|nr:hypothetical protein MJT46_012339 [Ovis ammon polii x Ovis aries]
MFTRLSSVIEDSRLRPRLLSIVFYRNQQHLKDLSGEDGCWFQQTPLKRTRDEDLAQVIELQDIIEKKSREQREMRDRLAALSAHVTELEKDLDTARKDLLKSKEANVKLQQDVREDNIGYLVSMEGPEMDFEPADRTRIGSKLCSWFECFLHGV